MIRFVWLKTGVFCRNREKLNPVGPKYSAETIRPVKQGFFESGKLACLDRIGPTFAFGAEQSALKVDRQVLNFDEIRRLNSENLLSCKS